MKIKPIIIGILVDSACSILLAIPIGVVAVIYSHSKDFTPESFEAYYYNSLPFMLLSLWAGLVAVALGGAVTARIAKEKRLLHALLMGIGTSLLSIPISLSLPLWFNVASYTLMIPCALLGGWIVARRINGQQAGPGYPPQGVGSPDP